MIGFHFKVFADFHSKIRAGNMQIIYKLKLPLILGADFSGVVAAIGKKVTTFKEGDEVFGHVVGGGSYAEYVVVPHDCLCKKPSYDTIIIII